MVAAIQQKVIAVHLASRDGNAGGVNIVMPGCSFRKPGRVRRRGSASGKKN
jgi:hypothetical protein